MGGGGGEGDLEMHNITACRLSMFALGPTSAEECGGGAGPAPEKQQESVHTESQVSYLFQWEKSNFSRWNMI